jgi:NAD(P)-dependent dehydrogenase (short-subunit alcohol dehydrogenase family)
MVNGRLQGAVDAAVAKLKPAASAAIFGIAANLSTAVSANLVARQFPDVETVINNLGIFEPKPFEEIPDGDWMRLFEVNVLSAVRLARLYLPGMKRNN